MAIKLFTYESLGSTSDQAAALLRAGEAAPPFAVLARHQLAGRGRRGEVWQSGVGNLFLTLALPMPAAVAATPGQQTCLPLWSGVLVAKLIAEQFKVRLTLKWPNDLLFAGAKVGGLLLETAPMAAAGTPAVLVGIGLNLGQSPRLTGDDQATSLGDILGRSIDPQLVGPWLAEAFASAFAHCNPATLAAEYEAFATGMGQVWTDGTAYAAAQGLAADGGLQLSPFGATEPLTLTSVQHGWRWLYQGAGTAPLLVADCGNSATKLGLFTGGRSGELSLSMAVPHGDTLALAAALSRLAAPLPTSAQAGRWPLWTLAVSAQATAELTAAASRCGLEVRLIPKRPVRRHGELPHGYDLTQLGIDRLALVEALLEATAAERHPRQGESIVVGIAAGTATTVDVVRDDGLHLGGLILPGLGTGLAALHQAAPRLPRLTPALPPMGDGGSSATFAGRPGGLGQQTTEAMTFGMLHMTIGAVERVLRDLATGVGGRTPLPLAQNGIVLTGGYGALLAPWLGGRYEPDLILRGARVLALGGVVPPSPHSDQEGQAP